MCVNYVTVRRDSLASFGIATEAMPAGEWEPEIWQDYAAPIIVATADGTRRGLVASYGMVPQHRFPPGTRGFSTMNARSETAGTLASFRDAWAAFRFCLIPMERWYEPNYEGVASTGRSERWAIGRADGAPLAVAGLWRAWQAPDGRRTGSFTQLTVNADAHPLLARFHRPGDEKRALVPVAPGDFDAWLGCRSHAAARQLLALPDAAVLWAAPDPMPQAVTLQAALF
ncbi:putative SOS response-associated peptidase YedK [Pseudoduganella lurida]|uniref:Abasic site processing protein n=1 Tax=Pseudoduganella lurida TaxID=1036180 RepID=A0A562RKE2_9BURK|nr:SOS response-associated peptidase family protein [Pseudoduganella lurida]TWI69527.1 putative SOS response-associated peptidase YedK [Pseudoduganella lurida]